MPRRYGAACGPSPDQARRPRRAQARGGARAGLRRANALGETPTRADAGVSDGGEVIHLLSEGGAFVRGDAAPDARATCVAASGARAPNSTCTACA